MALVLLLTLRKAVWHRLRPVAPPSPPHQCPGNAPAMPLQGPAGKHWWQPWRRSGLAGLARSVHQVFCVTRSRSHTLLQAPPPTPSLQAAHPRFSPTAAVLLACIYTSCVEALLLALSPRQSLSCSVPLTTDVNSRWRWHPPSPCGGWSPLLVTPATPWQCQPTPWRAGRSHGHGLGGYTQQMGRQVPLPQVQQKPSQTEQQP